MANKHRVKTNGDGQTNDCNGSMLNSESDSDGDGYVECSIDAAGGRFEVRSFPVAEEPSTAHCAGAASAVAHAGHAASLARLRSVGGRAVDLCALYETLRVSGLEYGPAYRTLDAAWTAGFCGGNPGYP